MHASDGFMPENCQRWVMSRIFQDMGGSAWVIDNYWHMHAWPGWPARPGSHTWFHQQHFITTYLSINQSIDLSIIGILIIYQSIHPSINQSSIYHQLLIGVADSTACTHDSFCSWSIQLRSNSEWVSDKARLHTHCCLHSSRKVNVFDKRSSRLLPSL